MSCTVALWLREPEVPVMVRKKVPVEVPEEMLSEDGPEPLMAAGLKLAEASNGNPETFRDTLPVNPFKTLIATLKPALSPALMVCDEGEAERVKSPVDELTARVMLVLLLMLPLAPVMTME